MTMMQIDKEIAKKRTAILKELRNEHAETVTRTQDLLREQNETYSKMF